MRLRATKKRAKQHNQRVTSNKCDSESRLEKTFFDPRSHERRTRRVQLDPAQSLRRSSRKPSISASLFSARNAPRKCISESLANEASISRQQARFPRKLQLDAAVINQVQGGSESEPRCVSELIHLNFIVLFYFMEPPRQENNRRLKLVFVLLPKNID